MPDAATRLASQPPAFVENLGQWDPQVKFQLRSGGKTIWLTDSGVVTDSVRPKQAKKSDTETKTPATASWSTAPRPTAEPVHSERLAFSEEFVGANSSPTVEALSLQPGRYNYLVGSDPKKWRTDAQSYAGVLYRNVWDGVDVRILRNGTDIDEDFVARPGADLRQVQVTFHGIEKLEIASDGSLLIHTAFGDLKETTPSIYQDIAGKRVPVEGRFILVDQTTYTFEAVDYRPEFALVVDPTLLYSTYLGGSGEDFGNAIAVDAAGNAYVAGQVRQVFDFPTTLRSFQPTEPADGQRYSFVAKLNPLGNALVYSTYLGQGGAYAVAVDAFGEAYVAGGSAQGDFATTAHAFQAYCGGSTFLAKLTAQGDGLLYATCLGGSIASEYGGGAKSMALDAMGNAYLTGWDAQGLPTTNGAFQSHVAPNSAWNAFVAVLNPLPPSGTSSLLYLSYLGGGRSNFEAITLGSGIAVDSLGMIYVTGQTTSHDFPTTVGAFQTVYPGGSCAGNDYCPTAFVAKFNPSLSGASSLVYSTFLGGGAPASGAAIAVDAGGSAYVTGSEGMITGRSYDPTRQFPTTAGAFQTPGTVNVNNDAFLTKLTPAGDGLVYSTLLGEAPDNLQSAATGIALGPTGSVYVVGYTRSLNFPTTPDAFQGFNYGLGSGYTKFSQAFIAELNADGSGLVYASLLGGTTGYSIATGIAVDPFFDAYVSGYTAASDFPVTSSAFQPHLHNQPTGSEDGFLSKFSLGSFDLSTDHAGNGGVVTLAVSGYGFISGSTETLTCAGQPTIVSNNNAVSPDGRTLTATFDLTGASPGTCVVVVTWPDGTTRGVAHAFTIEQGGSPHIFVDIIGRAAISQGQTQNYYVIVGNTGNTDSYDSLLTLTVPTVGTYDLGCPVPLPGDLGLAWPGNDWCHVPVGFTSGSRFVIPIWLYRLAAGSTSSQSVSFTLDQPPGPPHTVFSPLSADLYTYSSPFAVKGDLNLVNTSPIDQAIVQAAANTFPPAPAPEGSVQTQDQQQLEGVVRKIIGACVGGVSLNCEPFGTIGHLFGFLGDSALGAAFLQYADAVLKAALTYANAILNNYVDPSIRRINEANNVEYVAAYDPNELVGPSGEGRGRWLSSGHQLSYGIFFQNDSNASAAAQHVLVSNPLDATIDLSTVALRAIRIAGASVPLPSQAPLTTVAATIDLRPSTSLLVNVAAKLDVTTRTLVVALESIDPSTGLPPADPSVGALQPGAEGSILFTAAPKSGVSTGTVVSDEATVVFDANAPMPTQTWTNTLDNSAPASNVVALPVTEGSPSFTVQWSGTDFGAGVQDFTIYQSVDGGPFTAFQTNTAATSALFKGQPGHTYAFYSIARDLVGNVEPAKIVADTSTAVMGTGTGTTGAISGVVTTSGAVPVPLSGVWMGVFSANGTFFQSAPTGADGTYTVGGLQDGTYYVRASNSQGYVDQFYAGCVGCGPGGPGTTPVVVASGGTTSSINFALSLGGTFAGTVTDISANTPLANIGISVYTTSGTWVASTTTGSDGTYLTGAVPAGDYRVFTSNGTGYRDQAYNGILCQGCSIATTGTLVAATVGSTTSNINFALSLGGWVSGTVTDAGGHQLQGVGVSIFDGTGAYVGQDYTDVTGHYETPGVSAGSYYISTNNNAGYINKAYNNIVCVSCDVTTTTPISLTLGAASTADFSLDPGASISGTVHTTSGGPLAGVSMSANDASGRFVAYGVTNSDGTYVLGGLPTGSYYTHTFNTLGYVDQAWNGVTCLNCSGTTGTAIPATAPNPVTGTDFFLAPGSTISGVLTDAVTSAAVPNASVQIYTSSGAFATSGFTNASGAYSVSGLPTGTYYLRTFASGQGYIDQLYNSVSCQFGCTVTTGTPIIATAGFTTSVSAALLKSGIISGTLTDAVSGLPIANASVAVYDTSGNFVASSGTSPSGAYTIGGLLGTYYLRTTASFAGYVDQLYNGVQCPPTCTVTAGTPVSVTGGSTTTISFSLAKGGTISGTLTDAGTGNPIVTNNGVVDIYTAAGVSVGGAPTNGAGVYTLSGLPAGTYYLRTNASSLGYLDQLYNGLSCQFFCTVTTGTPVTVISGGGTTSGINFALSQGGSFAGTVTDAATNLPLGNVSIWVYTPSGAEVASTTTGSDGTYVTSTVPVGSYRVFTSNSAGYRDQAYNGIPCQACSPSTTGTLVTVTAGSATSNINFALSLGGWVSGTVTDAGGHPLPNVSVALYDDTGAYQGQGDTDVNGHYETPGVSAGSYFVRTNNNAGYINKAYNNIVCVSCDVTTTTPIAVTVGAASTAGFSLDPGASISGTVHAASGDLLAGVSMAAYDVSGQWVAGTSTQSDGTYVLNGLPSGSYYVQTSNNTQGYVNQAWNGVTCLNCSGTTGTAILVAAPAGVPGTDFFLTLGGTISGVVTDAVTTAAIPNASVQIYTSTGAFATSGFTNASGAYSVSGLPTGTYYLRTFASSQGYIDQLYNGISCASGCTLTTGTPISVTAGNTTPIGFALSKGGTISGTLIDASTGNPIVTNNGIVQVYNASGTSQVGNAQNNGAGAYSVSGLPAGTYYVRTVVSDLGYLDQLYNGISCQFGCTVTTGTQVTVTAGNTTSINFSLVKGGTISGRLTDAATGLPIANASVSVFNSSGVGVNGATTNASGVYQMSGLATGAYYIQTFASSLRYVDQLYNGISCSPWCNTTSGSPINVTAGNTTTINFSLAKGGTITGTITNASTGGLVQNASVSLYNASGAFVSGGGTSNSGVYTITVPAGTYFLRTTASNLGYRDQLYNGISCASFCTVTTGTPINATSGATTTINFALTQGGTVSGTLTDASSGLAISNGSVSVYDSSGNNVSGSGTTPSGVYTIGGLLPGTYYLRTTSSFAGYLDQLYNGISCSPSCTVTTGSAITVTAGNATTINFSLVRGGTVSGTLTDASSAAPIVGGSFTDVQLYNASGSFVNSAVTNNQGAYAFTGLAAGSYYLRTFASNQGYLDQLYSGISCASGCTVTTGTPVTLSSGGTTTISFSLAKGGVVSGTLTDVSTHAAIVGGSFTDVQIYNSSGSFVNAAVTNNQGAYSFAGLAAGSYYLRTFASNQGYLDQLYSGISCASGCTITNGTPVTVSSGGTTTINFALAKFGSISGTLTASGGGAISGASVTVYNSAGTVVTGASAGSGVYTVSNLVPGTYYIEAFATSYINQLYSGISCQFGCTVTTGTPVTVSSGGTTTINFALAKVGSITGTLTAAGGGAISGASVTVYNSAGTPVGGGSAGSGVYTVSNLAPGTYYIEASASAYISQLYSGISCQSGCTVTTGTPVTVPSGVATTINFTLNAAGAPLTVTLLAAGKPYDGTTVEPNANLSCTLAGVAAADIGNVSCTATNGMFSGAAVGSQQVTATVTISGPAAGHYTLGAPGTNVTSITFATAATADVVYGQAGNFTTAISNAGGLSATGLFQPRGVTFDGSGNLYVADTANNRVLFYPAGSTTATRVYGQAGSFTTNAANNGGVSATSLNAPYSSAVDGSGNLYIADYGNNRVLFYPAGSTTATQVYGQADSLAINTANNGSVSATSLSLPRAVILDGSGKLYVADYANNRVLVYPAGSTTATQVYGQTGSFTSATSNTGGISATSLSTPVGLALDGAGNLYVSEQGNNRVLFYPAGSTTATRVYGQGGSFATGGSNNGGISAGSLSGPRGIAVDGSGDLYVGDLSNSRILGYPAGSTTATQVYGQAGSFTTAAAPAGAIATNLASPWGITLDGSGNLYVADTGFNRVLEFNTVEPAITTAPLTVTLSAAGKPYDGTTTEPNANLNCTLAGVAAVDGGNVSCTATSGSFDGANAGGHTVTATVTINGTAASNYTLGAVGTTMVSTTATAVATITGLPVTATVTAASRPYDGTANATITGCTVSGVASGDTTGCVASAVATDNQFSSASVATGLTVTASNLSLTNNAAGNYTLTSTTATTTANIIATAATVTAGGGTKVYGTADPALSATTETGFVAGDAIGITLNSARAAGETAGSYATTATATGGSVANYAITYVPGNFAITPVTPTASANAGGGVYNGTAYTGSGTCSSGLTPAIAYASGSAPVNAGTTAFTVTCGDGGHNYVTVTANGNITISPAPTTVTAGSGTKLYGAADPALTTTETGFVAGDVAGITLGTTRAAGETVGTYTTTATATGGNIGDYQVTFVTGTFTIAPPLVVTVVFPNGGDRVFVNVPATIRWSSVGGTVAQPASFDVALSTNSGSTFTNIAGCTGLSGTVTTCVWTPVATTANARIRVTAHDITGPTSAATSSANFTVAAAPSVAVTSPNSGVSWTLETAHVVTWNHNLGVNSFMKIDLSRDSGASWETLAASMQNATATTGTFSWNVTGPVTSAALMRVSWLDGPATDVSNAVFSIVAPAITVTSPNTAATWRVGDQRAITFTHNLGVGQQVTLEVSRDSGTNWGPITTFTTTSATGGNYSWTVTGPITAHARVRATWAAENTVTSFSAVDFNVLSRVTVTAPNTAVSWTVGSNHTIIWTHNYGTTGTFNIDVSADGGATWSSMATGVPASTATAGTFTGALPMTAASTTALVRVSASGQSADPTQSDTGDVPFTLAAPTITVTVPNTAVGWRVGDVKNLQFADNFGIGEVVSLDLSRDNGTTWTSLGTLTTTASASGTLPWTVTGPLTAHARIRATWVANPSVTDESNVDFSILSRVTVTAPNTAVSWTAGSNHTITWTHNYGTTGTFDIDLSADGGATWKSMATSVPASTATAGTFTGPLQMTAAAANALIRVSASGQSADPAQSDTSDMPFTLAAPTITVTVPNTAVSWRIGDVKTLTFTDNFGTGEVVSLDITRDGGAAWTSLTTLTTSAAASGVFSWTVTGPITAHARIRATWVTNPSVTDVSNVDFSILSRVTITAPNTAVSWTVGSSHTITWAHNYGLGATFDIDLSADGGATWTSVATDVPASTATAGTFTGELPIIRASSAALIRVSASGQSADVTQSDTSNVPFTLVAPTVTMTSPNTNVLWAIGSTHAITWSQNLGASESVTIELSTDGGATWSTIAPSVQNTAATSGTYSWIVTGPATTQGRVRVTWTRDALVHGISNVGFRIQ